MSPIEPAPPGRASDPAINAGSTSITGLLRQLTQEVTSLFTKEVALAKAEASESLQTAKRGVAAIATGAAVLMAGLIVLLLAAVWALATIIALWLSALIVGGVVAVIGFAMVQGGKKKLEPDALRPERTINQLNKDQAAVTRH